MVLEEVRFREVILTHRDCFTKKFLLRYVELFHLHLEKTLLNRFVFLSLNALYRRKYYLNSRCLNTKCCLCCEAIYRAAQ